MLYKLHSEDLSLVESLLEKGHPSEKSDFFGSNFCIRFIIILSLKKFEPIFGYNFQFFSGFISHFTKVGFPVSIFLPSEFLRLSILFDWVLSFNSFCTFQVVKSACWVAASSIFNWISAGIRVEKSTLVITSFVDKIYFFQDRGRSEEFCFNNEEIIFIEFQTKSFWTIWKLEEWFVKI